MYLIGLAKLFDCHHLQACLLLSICFITQQVSATVVFDASMQETIGRAGKQYEDDIALHSGWCWEAHAFQPSLLQNSKCTRPTCTPCSRPLYTCKQIDQTVTDSVESAVVIWPDVWWC